MKPIFVVIFKDKAKLINHMQSSGQNETKNQKTVLQTDWKSQNSICWLIARDPDDRQTDPQTYIIDFSDAPTKKALRATMD